MRKRRGIIVAAVVLFLAVLLAGMLIWGPFRFATGTYIAAESPFLLFDGGSGEPVVMVNGTGKEDAFAKLRTGDKVLVVHNGTMMLSYPAQMDIYFCIRLKKGDASDIPKSVLESLEEMGWIQGGALGQD